jgi:hypothetical protein
MSATTSFQNFLVMPGRPEVGVLFPAIQDKFLFCPPLIATRARFSDGTNESPQAWPQEQRVARPDALVRLPSVRASKWKVTVLQQWIGRVEHLAADRFIATLEDATNSKNPPEEVELDREEVSRGDLPLLAKGAVFYCSIGYRDTPGGQRERIFILRFARQPRLSKADVKRIFEEADHLAAILENA